MNPFRYAVSLRISHPTIDPLVMTETLRLQPDHAYKKGDRRSTPRGDPLEGIYDKSFWTHRYTTPEDSQCAAFIHSAALSLLPHRQFFDRLQSEGGRAEFFIGWFGDRNFGNTFPDATLSLLAELHIELAFDVYPEAPQII